MAQGLSMFESMKLEEQLSTFGLDKDDITMVVNLVDGLKGNKFNGTKDVTNVTEIGIKNAEGVTEFVEPHLAETCPIEMLEVLLLH